MKQSLPYRACAGIMVLNDAGRVFVAQRLDSEYDAWQMPQGGIDEGEDAKEAALRELLEEIGTNHVEILAESKRWLQYDLPDDLIGKVWKGKYQGQRQKWFLVRFLGEDSDINIATDHPEFSEWKWENPMLLPELIVPFKKQLYKDVLQEFRRYIVKKRHE